MIRCVHALYFHVFESVGGVYERLQANKISGKKLIALPQETA